MERPDLQRGWREKRMRKQPPHRWAELLRCFMTRGRGEVKIRAKGRERTETRDRQMEVGEGEGPAGNAEKGPREGGN